MVDHVLRRDPSAITRLVRAELAAGAEDPGPAGAGTGTGIGGNESFGIYLLAAARKPAARKPVARRPAARPSMSGAGGPAAAPQAVG
jgi:hypothetical protein